ncbi:MAG: stalk domain-containing protein [Oscillospiraceae bacterium]|nr:stalk domain-containing protein [Oscillospiraceae bacterium]
MKKILSMILALVLLLAFVPSVLASANAPISVFINGQRVVFPDQNPVVIDGRTLVPVRGVFEDLNFFVDWNPNTRRATLTRGSDTIIITVGSNVFTTNGVSHTLDVAAQTIGGRTMLPLRLVLESVGYTLDWNSATSTVTITSQAPQQVTISTSASPTTGGTVTGGGTVNHGSNVTLRATPNAGWAFSGWYEGNARVGTNAVWTFNATANRTLQARFNQVQQWTITTSSTTGGTVSGGGTFGHNAPVTLVATPQSGWVFAGWYEGNTRVHTNATWTFNATANRTLQARFNQWTITTTTQGGGTATGGGMFNQNETVTLVATPQAGWNFDGWYEGNVRVNTSAVWQFAATANRNLQARFIQGPQQWTITPTVAVNAGGTVAGGGQVNHNANATIQAIPNSGWQFMGWYENNVRVSTEATWTFAATANRTLEARFAQVQWTITTTTTVGGNATGGGVFNHGAQVTLIAAPIDGWTFIGWYEGDTQVSLNATLTFAATANRSLQARFVVPG